MLLKKIQKGQKARHAKPQSAKKPEKNTNKDLNKDDVAVVAEAYGVYGKDGPDGSLDKAG